jgi:predicted nucleic acid-binding protein
VTYLVDASVLSEATKPALDARVVRWLWQNEREIVVDTFILGEIRFGIYLLPAGRRRRRLEQWFNKGVARIACPPWEARTGLRWAKLLADLRVSVQALPIKDSLIAATAIVHGLIVVTKNTRDFSTAGVRVPDPADRSPLPPLVKGSAKIRTDVPTGAKGG